MKKIFLTIVLVAVATLVYFGISSNNKGASGTLNIGVISVLSGEFSSIGENYLKGILLAKEQYEIKHPELKINVISENDSFDSKRGLSAYKKLAYVDKVDGLINLSTPTIDIIADEVSKSKMPVIQFGIQNYNLKPDNIFQMSPKPEDAIYALGTYLDKTTNFKKVLVIYQNGQPFEQFFETFKSSYKQADLNSIKLNTKEDVPSSSVKAVEGKYDLIVILTMPEPGALLVKEIRKLSNQDPLFAIDVQLQTGFETYKNILGGNLAPLNGSFSVWLESKDTTNFQEEYFKKYGVKPGLFADYGYDSFNTLIEAYIKNPSTWVNNIGKIDTIGASGNIKFDTNGVRIQNLQIKHVIDGQIGNAE